MRHRLGQLDTKVPLTAIYGNDSWMKPLSTEEFEEARGSDRVTRGLTLSTKISYARHHVYARIEEFNEAVVNALTHQAGASAWN